ncbi:MAG: M20 aminoacylase family protein [Burkholderiaceae bacterium]|nr:M20 aminoacylase family protein [Burkholderiaceae bacterium]
MTPIPVPLLARIVDFVTLRRDIHAHPELGLAEFRTSDLIAAKLIEWGYDVTRGIAGTGLVGQLKRGTGDKRLGLRADMDALPIQETTGLPHASRHDGVMHACGHDGHTTMLLAAAQHLAEHGRFNGTLNLIFQPAEEHPGGAKMMLAEGLFERFPCDAVFAMHNMPGITQGHLAFIDGPAMASSDDVTITIRGTGGHGAMPHLANDPILAASSIVLGLQSIVSRNVDPRQTAVITVGAFNGGKANNVIPSHVTLELSVRALDRDVRNLLERRIKELVESQAASFGLVADIQYKRDYPVLVNTLAETALARDVGLELLGDGGVILHSEPLTGSEDFACMLEHCPGSYMMIGNGDGEGGCMVHNPGYDFNDDNISIGAAYWCLLTERFLPI